MRSGLGPEKLARGFTMIELIMVLVLVGLLAVFAASQLDTKDFESQGFHDETLALLRYAQKTAIAQRRTVCVALNAGGVGLTIDTNVPPDLICDAALVLPNSPKGGSGLTAPVPSFHFTPLGSTDQAANVLVTIAGSASITVEAATGYVHD